MLKQSPSRNQRTKGFFKAKQRFKLFILVAVSVWLIYQLNKHSHDDKKAGRETKELGRKGFNPWTKKPYESIDDAKGSKHERVKELRGDDNIVIGHDRDRTEEEEPEEVEDLIDEEDKEKEEDNEDEDGEVMAKHIEDMKLLEGQGYSEDGKNIQATSEKH